MMYTSSAIDTANTQPNDEGDRTSHLASRQSTRSADSSSFIPNALVHVSKMTAMARPMTHSMPKTTDTLAGSMHQPDRERRHNHNIIVEKSVHVQTHT